jgi:lipopolysaccharide assembly outer membrane protein LptD (OstA)
MDRPVKKHIVIPNSKFCNLLILQFLLSSITYSQTKDTLSVASTDSSARRDSIASIAEKKKPSGIDTSVVYSSLDSIVYSYPNRMMHMYGKGDVKFQTMGLKSERIDVNWNANELEAYGVLDSSKIGKTDSVKQLYRGTPVMVDGGETYEGWKIGYNFKSQKGRISLGETVMEQGYYHGQHIKKIEKDVLYVANGRFTTCDLSHPHYYFFSPRMRVTVRDKIVAEPIYLYIADVPVFVLPFGVFPSKSGRCSGIIAPAYGDDARRGKFISHLGYYEAISDYTDLSLAGDWYSQGGWKGYENFRYAKRYDFSGALTGEYSRILIGEPTDFDRQDEANYLANLRHNQQFNPSTRLDIDFTFASNNSYKTSNNYSDYLRQEIYSNATVSKSWEGTNNSMSANISRRQDLLLHNVDATFPSISFSHSQSYPFRSEKKSRGLSAQNSEYAWYELIGVGYNGQAVHRVSNTRPNDTTEFTTYDREGISHGFSINAAPKAGYFTVAPAVSYSERWYDKSTKVDSVDRLTNAPVKRDVKGFEAVRFFSAGVSASTKFYGMFQPPIPGVAGFRHTVTPSVSYSFQPDFSKEKFGYYASYRDTLGRKVLYNRFEKEVFGGAPAGESQAIGLSVGNLFEMKTEPRDSIDKGSKYQILNLGASLAYNFAADQFRLSDLSLNYRTDIGQYLGISGGSNYRFYVFDQASGQRVNKFLIKEGKGIAEMTSFNINLSTSLRGERKKGETHVQNADTTAGPPAFQQSGYRGLYEEEPPDFSIPWNLSLNFNFAQFQENPAMKTRSTNISANLGFNLTENWKFSATGSYDVIQRQFAAPRITIDRDLHCWTMNFSWTPIGQLAGYRFELKVKAPQLQDIKLTKQSRDSGYY